MSWLNSKSINLINQNQPNPGIGWRGWRASTKNFCKKYIPFPEIPGIR
jgi:hypothetical protein